MSKSSVPGNNTQSRHNTSRKRSLSRPSSLSSSRLSWLALVRLLLLVLIGVHLAWTIGCAWLIDRNEHTPASPFHLSLRAWHKSDGRFLDPLSQHGNDGSTIFDKPNKPSRQAWSFDASKAREIQAVLFQSTGRKSLTLKAYAEPPLNPPNENPSLDTPRLSVRTHSPEALTTYEYPAIQSCSDIPKYMPTGHPSSQDVIYGTNAFNKQPLYPDRHEYAHSHCPVDADPFLPWVHDVFPSSDGKYIEFVAHNKRRCNTDPKFFWDDINNLEPQVTMMQPIPIKRLLGGDAEAERLQPNMWKGNATDNINDWVNDGVEGIQQRSTHRYRLASHEEADADAMETRLICRFHTLAAASTRNPSTKDSTSPSPHLEQVILGESLSVAPYNYELLNLRKPGSQPMLTRPESKFAKGGSGAAPHNSQVWNAMHHFRCPVPDNLVGLVKSGESVVDDVASIYVDVVPIRTYPRDTREGYIKNAAPTDDAAKRFDPNLEWGPNHVLPAVEASGRWVNFPVCRPPASTGAIEMVAPVRDTQITRSIPEKKHYLAGCTWASAAYTTRGDGNFDTSTSKRLFEWLTYNLDVVGFDHIYVYDNTEAHTSEVSLSAITDLFPRQVTRIEWPHRICNNNRPAHSNTGERSSQHAAEASCWIRYGPNAEWLANLDSDEYLVPVGKWTNISDWLSRSVDKEESTHILSFFQTRAKPNAELMQPYQNDHGCKGPSMPSPTTQPICLQKNSSKTYLETYNCEPTKLPKPNDWAWRAKKQIYRPWYVLNHFVHYSVATTRINDQPEASSPRFKESRPYERRVDELSEAFMLHTKSTLPEHTAGWHDRCRSTADNCPVGVPWPLRSADTDPMPKLDGLQHNCYRHEGVINVIVPRLQAALAKRAGVIKQEAI